MKLHIDNIDGFNEVFKTSFINLSNGWYDVNIAALKGVDDEKRFWEIVNSNARRFSVLTEKQYEEALEDA